MTCWVVVPIKAPGAGKTRLAGILSDQARRTLVAAMLAHVVDVAMATKGVDKTVLLGPDRHGLDPALQLLPDPDRGLDAALASAIPVAIERGVRRLIVLPADLATIRRDDIAALIGIGLDEIGIAPDRAGAGTNALSLPIPIAARFGFAFGEGSFARHRRSAERIGLVAHVIRRDGLALDIDQPEDIAALPAAFQPHRAGPNMTNAG